MDNIKGESSLIVMPTFNESGNIAHLIEDIFKFLPKCHILVVDDNSPDNTAKIVETVRQERDLSSSLHLLQRAGKQGLGTAYLTGFQWALERDYQYVFEMDGDFSHNPKYLPHLLQAAQEGAGLVLGSRYVSGGGVTNWPWYRQLLSRFGSLYARFWLKIPVHDVTGGFKCFHRNTLELLPLEKIRANGYCFQIELTYFAWRLGVEIVEVPIVFTERAEGKSKMSWAITLEAIKQVPGLPRRVSSL